MGLAETTQSRYILSVANGVWGFALTILRQVKIPLVPACGGEFCSCIQCGIFVRCYYKELFPQAQFAPFCPGGVRLGSFLFCPSKGIWTAIILQLPHMFAQLCLEKTYIGLTATSFKTQIYKPQSQLHQQSKK